MAYFRCTTCGWIHSEHEEANPAQFCVSCESLQPFIQIDKPSNEIKGRRYIMITDCKTCPHYTEEETKIHTSCSLDRRVIYSSYSRPFPEWCRLLKEEELIDYLASQGVIKNKTS